MNDGYLLKPVGILFFSAFWINCSANASERREEPRQLVYVSPVAYFGSMVTADIPLPAVPRVISKSPAPPLFTIYADKASRQNHFTPSGWMGDTGDLTVEEGSTEHPHEGSTCIKVKYSAVASQNYQWAGIFWQEPINEWAGRSSGYDLSKMKRLTFWARGEQGGEVINPFKVGGVIGTQRDSGSARIGPVTLGPDWRLYTIDLSKSDMSRIAGGFSFVTSFLDNPSGATFYLDDIRFEP